jgi:hypothetical protein
MSNNKWVDNEIYFGPDRRRGGLGKRWGDRRHYDDAAGRPPLGTVLRRLRIMLNSAASPDDHRRALDFMKFACSEAERRRLMECSGQLNEALKLVLARDYVRAERCVLEAQALANAR